MRKLKIRFPKDSINAFSLAIIGAAIVLLLAGIIYYAQQERQRKAIQAQTNTTNQLIQEVKDISEENKRLNTENRNFSYCTATLFARWTQEQQPIVIEDLDKCVINSFPKAPAPSVGQAPIQIFQQPAQSPQQQSPQQQPQGQPQGPPQNPPQQPPKEVLPPNNLLNLEVPCVTLLFLKTCN